MSGNGVDLGVIHQLLVSVAAVQQEHGRQLADLRSQIGDLRSQIGDLRSEMGDLRSQVSGLRQQVIEYHASVLGHGILISEIDRRVRRIEEHLGLPFEA